jgi:hypothetical protein
MGAAKKIVVINNYGFLTEEEARAIASSYDIGTLGLITFLRAFGSGTFSVEDFKLSFTALQPRLVLLSQAGIIGLTIKETSLQVEMNPVPMEEKDSCDGKTYTAFKPLRGPRPIEAGNLNELWGDFYKQRTKVAYSWTIADYAILKRLVKTYGYNDIAKAFTKFFSLGEDEVQPYGYTIRVFASRIDSLLTATKLTKVTGIPDELRYGQ